MEMVATKIKAIILQSAIDTTYTLITDRYRPDLIFEGNLDPYFDAVFNVTEESATYKAGTWDFYAPRLGLKLRQADYQKMRFILDENNFFTAGAYTPQKLFNEITKELGDEIIRELAGSLRPLIAPRSAPGDLLIRGALIERGFLENR